MSGRDDEGEDQTVYEVVVNGDRQYSIWPADRENAVGWSDAGMTALRAECLAYIEEAGNLGPDAAGVKGRFTRPWRSARAPASSACG